LELPQSSLSHITFRGDFHDSQLLSNLPSTTLTYLSLTYGFNSNVDNLPQSLKQLHFGPTFNQSIDHLPAQLTQLIFSANSRFNQPVDHLPLTLLKLKFGVSFNHLICHLPPSLTHLSLRRAEKIYPHDKFSRQNNLSENKYNQCINSLPPYLISFRAYLSPPFFTCQLPNSLTSLCCNFTPAHLPTNLRRIHFYNSDSLPALPSTLQVIKFCDFFNQPINLPPNITKIYFGQSFKLL
jgi:hypothetical protein